MTLIYSGYLACIAVTDSWISVLAWLIYFVFIEFWQMFTSGTDNDNQWEKLEQWGSSIWNWIDVL
jgi:hypothetical protein